ncbi:MAG: hypothetical protein HKO64_02095, partial [Xanthomonadales bacterium]|nr:hypothetical protein [Gammaproteobacteria bacterium]NNL94392.1 hypothetical protein [Xanthomonadales bacterium]
MYTVTSFASLRARATSLISPTKIFLLLSCLVVGLASAPAYAVHDDTTFDNIEMDGNTVNNGGAVEGVDDWNDVFTSSASAA